jgi:hypothetical protein
MARMFPQGYSVPTSGAPVAAAERRLFERLARELGDGWSVIRDCELHADGEVDTIEFVLVHRDYGLALLGLAGRDGGPDPEPAIGAMRRMLDEIGFGRRFRGDLPIVGRMLRPDTTGDLVEILFGDAPSSTIADPTWPDWLIQRLVPAPAATAATRADQLPVAAEALPRLRAPTPEDAWRVSEVARTTTPVAQMREEPVALATGANAPDKPIAAVSQAPRTGYSILVGMGFAALVVAVVLVGMALLSHGNG